MNVQLSAYSYAWTRHQGERPKLRMNCPLKIKAPRLERPPVHRTEADDVRLFVLAKEVRRAARAGVFPPRPERLCRDYEYKYLYPLWA